MKAVFLPHENDRYPHPFIRRAFDEDRDEVIQGAIVNGVGEFYLPAIDSTYTQRMLELEKLIQIIFA